MKLIVVMPFKPVALVIKGAAGAAGAAGGVPIITSMYCCVNGTKAKKPEPVNLLIFVPIT